MLFFVLTRDTLPLFREIINAPYKDIIYGSEEKKFYGANIGINRAPSKYMKSHVSRTDPLNYLKSNIKPYYVYHYVPDYLKHHIQSIYLPDMFLADGTKIKPEYIMDVEIIRWSLDLFDNDETIVKIFYSQTGYSHDLFIFDDEKIDLMHYEYNDYFTQEHLDKLTYAGIIYFFDGETFEIPNIDDPEIYYIVSLILYLPEYQQITGKQHLVSYTNLFRKFPEWSMEKFKYATEKYDEIFNELIGEPDLYDLLIKLTEYYISTCAENSIEQKRGYFNIGFILSVHDDPQMRDLAINYLFKAGDLPEAKRLRARLFADKYNIPFGNEFELDDEIEFLLIYEEIIEQNNKYINDKYDKIFNDLIDKPELHNLLIKMTEYYVSIFDENSMEQKKGYFNLGFILSLYDDSEMRDFAIEYLYKAGDLSEAKRLRSRLFADKMKMSFGLIEDNLDDEIELWLREKTLRND